jgi:hypothetical protein
MANVCLNFDITDSSSDAQLRTAVAVDFFMRNYPMFIDEAIEAGKSDLELAETVENVAQLAFAVADMFMAKKNHVTGTTREDEYDYV